MPAIPMGVFVMLAGSLADYECDSSIPGDCHAKTFLGWGGAIVGSGVALTVIGAVYAHRFRHGVRALRRAELSIAPMGDGTPGPGAFVPRGVAIRGRF